MISKLDIKSDCLYKLYSSDDYQLQSRFHKIWRQSLLLWIWKYRQLLGWKGI